jgi:hypothetical protein
MMIVNRVFRSGIISLALLLSVITSLSFGAFIAMLCESSGSLVKWILVSGFVAAIYAIKRRNKDSRNDDDSFKSTLTFTIPETIGDEYTATQSYKFRLFNDYEELNEPFERVGRIIGSGVAENHAVFYIDVEFDNKKCFKIIRSMLLVNQRELELSTVLLPGYDHDTHMLVLHYRESTFPFIVKISNEGVFIARRLC